MALRKNAHQLFTDREEPRKAFWNTLRKLEENPGSSQIITYYGEGGIGKTWLLQDLKRRLERLDPENDENLFDDGFVFRGEYIPVIYNLETSTDVIEMLCQIRYSLYQLDENLPFPLFDCAIKKYKEITGKNLVSAEGGSDSFLAKYEKYLDTAAMFIPQLGQLQTIYGYVKKGGSWLTKGLEKINDKKLRNLYSEYFEAITTSETADDIRDNIAEFFKTDLNIADRDYSIVFFIDTFELLTYKTGLSTHNWLTGELAKETKNTLWVFAGRNRIYKDFDNEHLLGDLSEEDTKYYLKEKVGITDEEVIERIYEITHGTPIFLDICVQNYRNEGEPPAASFQNLNKEQLLKRYVKYLSDSERLVIRIMSSMSHWTDHDYREVFNAVHNGSFSQYVESYNKVIRSTMIEKDNEDRYFLHRAVRAGIYEDPDYPEEIKTAVRDAMLDVYGDRAIDHVNPVYYAARIADLTAAIFEEDQVLSDDQIQDLSYTMLYITDALAIDGVRNTKWFSSLVKEYIVFLADTDLGAAYLTLFLADLDQTNGNYAEAAEEAQYAESIFSQEFGGKSRSMVFARKIRAICCFNTGDYQTAEKLLESCVEDYKTSYPENDPDQDIAASGISQMLVSLKVRMNNSVFDFRRDFEDHLEKNGWTDAMTLMSAANYANTLRLSGNHEEARKLYEKVYETSAQIYGEDFETTLVYLNNLAQCCYACGRKERAEQLIMKAAAAAQNKENTRISGIIFNTIGYFRLRENKYEESLEFLNKAIGLFEKIPGLMDTEEAATTLIFIGDVYRCRGQYTQAYEPYARAGKIFRSSFGDEDARTVYLQALTGICEHFRGKKSNAFNTCQTSWQKLMRICGETHEYTETAAAFLEYIYDKRNPNTTLAEQFYRYRERYYRTRVNNDEKADFFAKKAQEVHDKLYPPPSRQSEIALWKEYEETAGQYGKESVEALEVKQKIMRENWQAKDYRKSLALAQQTYETALRLKSEHDPLALHAMEYAAFCQRELRQFEECISTADELYRISKNPAQKMRAIKLKQYEEEYIGRYEDALQTAKTMYSDALNAGDDNITEKALEAIKRCYNNLKQYDRKAEAVMNLYQFRKEKYGSDDKRTMDAESELVMCFRKVNDHEKALDYAVRLFNHCRDAFGEDARETADALVWIGSCEYYLHRYEDALVHLNRADGILRRLGSNPALGTVVFSWIQKVNAELKKQ